MVYGSKEFEIVWYFLWSRVYDPFLEVSSKTLDVAGGGHLKKYGVVLRKREDSTSSRIEECSQDFGIPFFLKTYLQNEAKNLYSSL